MTAKSKFEVGDKVKVVKYGALIQSKELSTYPIYYQDKDIIWYDITSKIVGREGIVDKVSCNEEHCQYGVAGIKEKHAWYSEDQLEKI